MTIGGLSPNTPVRCHPPGLQRSVAFGQHAQCSPSVTFQAPIPGAAATNRFPLLGLELLLIPCLAIPAIFLFKNTVLRFAEAPMKVGYWAARKVLGPKIPSLYALPKWGFWDLMPNLRKRR